MNTAEKKQLFLDKYPLLLRATKTAEAIGINECTHYEWLKSDEKYSQAFQAFQVPHRKDGQNLV